MTGGLGKLNVGMRSEIFRMIVTEPITSEDKRLAWYDDFTLPTVHCSCGVNRLKPVWN